MIKAVIIEDEEQSSDILMDMLKDNFGHIQVLALARTVEEGKQAIEMYHPELVFSDIQLGDASAFDMLQQLQEINFEIIFITAFEKYAIQAIKFCALDYLLKPFSLPDLSTALYQFQQKKNKMQSALQYETLFHNLKRMQKDPCRIALPTQEKLEVVSLNDVVRCEANINYTTFYLTSKHKIIVSKTLKEYEELLQMYDFIRVHKSHLINLQHVKNYTRGEGGSLQMADGSTVEVSRRKKDELLKKIIQI